MVSNFAAAQSCTACPRGSSLLGDQALSFRHGTCIWTIKIALYRLHCSTSRLGDRDNDVDQSVIVYQLLSLQGTCRLLYNICKQGWVLMVFGSLSSVRYTLSSNCCQMRLSRCSLVMPFSQVINIKVLWWTGAVDVVDIMAIE